MIRLIFALIIAFILFTGFITWENESNESASQTILELQAENAALKDKHRIRLMVDGNEVWCIKKEEQP